MGIFILLDCSEIKVNEQPVFQEILLNTSDIICVEHTYNWGKSIVHIRSDISSAPFYCKQSAEAICSLLKDKGVEVLRP